MKKRYEPTIYPPRIILKGFFFSDVQRIHRHTYLHTVCGGNCPLTVDESCSTKVTPVRTVLNSQGPDPGDFPKARVHTANHARLVGYVDWARPAYSGVEDICIRRYAY